MKHMLGTLSTDVILFCKAKTVRFEEQIISKDKYLSMQVKWRLLCLVFFKYFPNHAESENWGISLASNVWLLLKLHVGTCIFYWCHSWYMYINFVEVGNLFLTSSNVLCGRITMLEL